MIEKQSPLFLLSFATQLGFSLATPLVICIGLGLLADSQFGSKPVGTIIGAIFGFITSQYMLYKSIKPYLKK